jgi:nucleotide-binding universal stress UspA family protein
MSTLAGAPIVVGIDGSAHQRSVIDWAVSEARWRRRPLELVHAFDWALLGASIGMPPYGAVQESLHEAATQIRDEALATVRAEAPDLDVTAQVVDGRATAVLIDRSQTAAVVVLGHRGRGGFAGLAIGSVAAQVAAHAACPVVVVRPAAGHGPHADRVLVAVDGSPSSAGSIEFAFEEAALRGLGLTALHAWTVPVSSGAGDMLPLVYDVDDVQAEEVRVLVEALAGWQEKYPDVNVRRVVTRDRPAGAVIEAAQGAALLVVGARGHGGFPGLHLGSVSRAVLHHAPCPVAIVRRR